MFTRYCSKYHGNLFQRRNSECHNRKSSVSSRFGSFGNIESIFGKTHKNVTENKYAIIQVLNPENLEPWLIDIYYKRTETEGELFDAMEMQLEAIASMSGMSDVFKLKAADIFEIRSVRKFTEAKES